MPTVNGYVTGEPVEAVDINQYFLRGARNAIINGDMSVNQRGTAGVVSDANYSLDRWVFLGDATTGSITQSNGWSSGLYSLGCVPQTNNKKFGFLQIIEQKNLAGLRNATVSLSFKMFIGGSNINNVKAAVLSWAGTADSVTRDVVSSWNSTNVTPTFVANWTLENTPSNLYSSSFAWTDCKLTANVDSATVNNLAVFIWCDTTAATSSDSMYITDVQLEAGSIATPFERRTHQEQLSNCQRYYQRFLGGTNGLLLGYGFADAIGTAYNATFPLRTTMRAIPTIGIIGTFTGFDTSVQRTITALSSTRGSTEVASGDPSYSGGTFNANRIVLFFSGAGTNGVDFSSEL